jgi:hypothetical protein
MVEAPATVELVDGFFGPEFGKLVPRPVIAWHLSGPLPLAAVTTLVPAG